MRRNRPALITDAERSQDDQLMSREVRYVIMMSIRVVCLVAAAVLVGVHAPLLKLWLPLLIVGMVVLPWLAVILANDRPPKEKHRLRTKLHPRQTEPPAPPRALTPAEQKIIDHEE